MNSENLIFAHELQDMPPDIAMKRLDLANKPPEWRRMGQASDPPLGHKRMPRFMLESESDRGNRYISSRSEAEIVTAALMLRRPILVTGFPGMGKSNLAYAVAQQLGLGSVLRWNVTSRSTLKDALYSYDVIARLHDASFKVKSLDPGSEQQPVRTDDLVEFGKYFLLGPLGTALLPSQSSVFHPRVLLIDEIDKSDADLPSDLLHVLEEGHFDIPEIARLNIPAEQEIEVRCLDYSDDGRPFRKVKIPATGRVQASDFPLIIMTSNGEREFPPAFLRRCLRLDIKFEDVQQKLERIIRQYFPEIDNQIFTNISETFRTSGANGNLSLDQILQALALIKNCPSINLDSPIIKDVVLKPLIG